MSKAPAKASRKQVSSKRIVGTVHVWQKTWGWIKPVEELDHPDAGKTGGRVYIHQSDLRGDGNLEIGSDVSFFLYVDRRGLGAMDCSEVSKGVAEAKTNGVTGEKTSTPQLGEKERPLPEGWEKHWSSEHAEYYYWHRPTKESTWTRPTAEDEDEEGLLPKGWTKHYDEDRHEWYYWHKKSKTSTWERPSVVAPVVSTGDAAAGAAAQAEPQKVAIAPDGPVIGQTRLRGRITKWHGFFGWIGHLHGVAEDLKPMLAQNGDKIYLNWRDVRQGSTLQAGSSVEFNVYVDDTGLCASDVCPCEKVPRKKRAKKDEMGELADQWVKDDEKFATDLAVADKVAKKKAKQADSKEGAAEPEEVDETAPLLPGWEQHWSNDYGQFYYWHKATKISTWDRPVMPGAAGDAGGKDGDKAMEGEGSEPAAVAIATPITPLVPQAGRSMTPLTPTTGLTTAPPVETPETVAPSAEFRAAAASGLFKGHAKQELSAKQELNGGTPQETSTPMVRTPWQKAPKLY